MKNNNQRGLIKLIVIIVLAILAISYFGINIQQIAESDTGKANFGYVWSILEKVWAWLVEMYQNYLADYVEKITNFSQNIIVK